MTPQEMINKKQQRLSRMKINKKRMHQEINLQIIKQYNRKNKNMKKTKKFSIKYQKIINLKLNHISITKRKIT